MKLKIPNPLISVSWLYENRNDENLVILDASITKVGTKESNVEAKRQIKNAVFFDLKNVFLDKEGEYPNTIPSEKYFEEQVQKLGINKDSCVVIYDDLGVYSSPRAWWLFKVFGFENLAVLNGGLPEWKSFNYPIEIPQARQLIKGDFKAEFKVEKVSNTDDVLDASNKNECILDARSKGRFDTTTPEPRADLRGGHIPNSKSLPYTELQVNGEMKSQSELTEIFNALNPKKDKIIFSCGSGITACILALGNEAIGNKNYSVYDGSWTEWASRMELPIEK